MDRFEAGSVWRGTFRLSAVCTKRKYAIILYHEGNQCLLMTYTTSRQRAGVADYVHGKNPRGSNDPKSYVFLSSQTVGYFYDNEGKRHDFQFPKDSMVVPDYGYTQLSVETLIRAVPDLTCVCRLFTHEYIDLIYTLYQSKKTPTGYKKIFEKILNEHIK